MERFNIIKLAPIPPLSADFDILGEISLSDDQDTALSTFSGFVPQSNSEVETSATSKLSHEPVHHTDHLPQNETKDQLSFLQAKILELESQNCQLTGKLSELLSKETVSKSTETADTRESGPPHPGSIMSLSTGSEESAVDEERFVKVKSNCEIETSSSKASSQSGKENFELEEQVSTLTHEVDSLKSELKAKDDDYIKVKLELEALLLEKNVEAESSSQINKLKHELNLKDTEINEIRLDLKQVIENCLEYFPGDMNQSSTNSSMELTLFQVNTIAQMLKASMESAKERDEELANCIRGYQAVSQDYETLQNEYQSLKENLNTGAQDELERFKQELLSKDEDLFEIQTQYDVTVREVEEKNKLLEQLQQKVTSLESQVQIYDLSEKLYVEKLNQASEKCQQATEELYDTMGVLTEKSELIADLQSLVRSLEASVPNPVVQIPATSPVKSLQRHCIDKIQDSALEHQAQQKALTEKILDLNNDKSHLESLLSSKEEEISKLNCEMERLMANIQVYQDSIEQKTAELATCANSKVEEIGQIKDSQIAHLAKTIESQRDEIFRMFQIQNEAVAHRDSMQNYVNQLEASLAEANAKYQTYQLTMSQHENELQREISGLKESMRSRIEHEEGIRAALKKSYEEMSILKERHDQVEKELTGKYSASIERLKAEIRAEFERKHAEDEMLRESEQLSDREAVAEMMTHISQIRNELAARAKEVSILTSEKLGLEQEFEAKEEEIMNLQERLTLVENELFLKNEANLKLQTELEELQAFLAHTKSLLDGEVEARAKIERQRLEEIRVTQEIAKEQLQAAASQESSVAAIPQQSSLSAVPQESSVAAAATSHNEQILALQTQLHTEVDERKTMEHKVELLQSKISEIENSEIKSFEEGFMLKGWVRQLELENLKYQDQLNSLLGNSSDADSNPKLKTLQDEVMRLISALDERDKRCEQLTLEITRLLEERDGLQLKLSNVLKHNVALTERINAGQDSSATNQAPTYDREGLQSKLDQLEDSNYKMRIDLKREREARRLVQEQLLFSQTSRVYRDLNMRNRDAVSAPSSVESGTKSPSSSSQSLNQSLSDSGHISPSSASLDSVEHLHSASNIHIPSDSFPSSSPVVHI